MSVDVVFDGDGDVNVWQKKPSHVAVAVAVKDHVNVNDVCKQHFRTGLANC